MVTWWHPQFFKNNSLLNNLKTINVNIIFGSFTLITMKFWQNIYDEVLTKDIRWSHDKTFTMKKSWQSIYVHVWQSVYDEIIMTKHIRWNHDKTFTKKFWQNIYDEVLTKHIRRSHDKAFTMKFWQNIYDEVMTKSWQSIYV